MEQSKTSILEENKISSLLLTLGFVLSASIFPLIKYQPITGSLVNAALFLAVMTLGYKKAIFVGIIPSVAALAAGLLPPALAPAVPFIMAANTILIIAFNAFAKKDYWFGVITASFLKFTFLFLMSSALNNLLAESKIIQGLAAMLVWPQFFTALSGGLIAYIISKTISFASTKNK